MLSVLRMCCAGMALPVRVLTLPALIACTWGPQLPAADMSLCWCALRGLLALPAAAGGTFDKMMLASWNSVANIVRASGGECRCLSQSPSTESSQAVNVLPHTARCGKALRDRVGLRAAHSLRRVFNCTCALCALQTS
jgi:hypothetical protein